MRRTASPAWLRRHCYLLLDRLRDGSATNRELAAIALNHTARLSELRAAGYDIQITETDRETGHVRYALMSEREAPMRRTTPKAQRRKPVAYELIDPKSHIGMPIYAMLGELVGHHHDDLTDARIALAWNLTWKPDTDGRVTLGKCRKASDLDRELSSFDFVILLRRAFWLDREVTQAQRRALLDHELCHAALKRDDKGEPVEDERGRLVYRIRKHDLEEFNVVVQRNGMWTSELEQMAAAMSRSARRPFVHCDECADNPGYVYAVSAERGQHVKRCPCWVAWYERRKAWREDQAGELPLTAMDAEAAH